jgi:hypothetical protein
VEAGFRRNYIQVDKDDPERAAAAIRKHCSRITAA